MVSGIKSEIRVNLKHLEERLALHYLNLRYQRPQTALIEEAWSSVACRSTVLMERSNATFERPNV